MVGHRYAGFSGSLINILSKKLFSTKISNTLFTTCIVQLQTQKNRRFSLFNVLKYLFCVIKRDIRIYLYIYMLPIADQTAGPIGLAFFVDTQGWPGGVIGLKNSKFFPKCFFFKFYFTFSTFFHGQRRVFS